MFLSGNSANYIDEMYVQWRQSPSSVHISWQTYFRNMEQGLVPSYEAFQPPPGFISNPPQARSKYNTVALHEASEGFDRIVRQGAKLQELIQAYRIHGHEKANLDPLGIRGLCDGSGSTLASDLDFRQHGFAESEMEQEFAIGSQILPTLDFGGRKTMKLREIINFCERTYCGNYAVEFYHIPDRKKRAWILNRVEVENPISYTKAEKRRILDRLVWSASFEHFLATKFPNEKRYGLEGGESFTPGVKALIDASAEHGVEDIVIGSQHRGRLSLLANLVRKPMEEMFQEFSLGGQPSHPTESGDVKTHLGMDYVRTCPSGHKVRISLLANPSHLEADDPVAAGKAKAIQHFTKDKDMSKTMCLTFHGDAAVSGQGIVYETLNLSNVPAFTTGGTIHVIVNNQIGFTTDPEHSRSTMYCSDIAKANGAPVFHVNADDVEAVVFVSKLAADWRATFKSDVFIDLICYRKFGHNEMDQPMFTQPFMYDKVTKKTPVLDIYTNKLVQESSFSPKEIQEHKQTIWEQMTQKFEASKDYRRQNIEWMTSSWPSVKSLEELATTTLSAKPTAIDETTYTRITDRIDAIPEDFSMHRNVAKALYARSESLRGGSSIDWTTAESLAFGSLLMEGTHVRLSGQDVERGTFSQRHAVLHNQNFAPNTDKIQKWVPLDHLTEQQARFTIHNSPLSEYGVLGFEYGYSLASPDALVQWEAQFGDFANTAQVIVDQYLSGGEAKWLSSSGLVLSLPHGYDGQGPEHSSARLERFLQLCNGDSRVYPPPDQLGRLHQDCNLQVVYMTTPANLFHVLRRQIHRDYRKRKYPDVRLLK